MVAAGDGAARRAAGGAFDSRRRRQAVEVAECDHACHRRGLARRSGRFTVRAGACRRARRASPGGCCIFCCNSSEAPARASRKPRRPEKLRCSHRMFIMAASGQVAIAGHLARGRRAVARRWCGVARPAAHTPRARARAFGSWVSSAVMCSSRLCASASTSSPILAGNTEWSARPWPQLVCSSIAISFIDTAGAAIASLQYARRPKALDIDLSLSKLKLIQRDLLRMATRSYNSDTRRQRQSELRARIAAAAAELHAMKGADRHELCRHRRARQASRCPRSTAISDPERADRRMHRAMWPRRRRDCRSTRSSARPICARRPSGWLQAPTD